MKRLMAALVLAALWGGGWTDGGGSGNPAVDINFAAGTATGCASVSSCLTVTRGGNETCEAEGGTVSYAATDTACITAEGLQVFEAGTNLVTQSQATTDWSNTNTSFGAAATAPDGSVTAFTITDDGTPGVHYVSSPTFAVSSGHTYVISVFVKAGHCTQASGECHWGAISGNGTPLNFGINFDAANCTALMGSGTQIAKVVPPKLFANGWCRIAFIVPVNLGSGSVGIRLSMVPGLSGYAVTPNYTGAGSTLLAWGFDVKVGTMLLPYCPTAGTAATCNADQIVASNELKSALEGAALRMVFKTAEFYDSQPPVAQTLLGVGGALTGLGIAQGYQAQSNWPSTAPLKSGGQIIRYRHTNYFGLSADGSGRSLALNGQTANSDNNGLSASAEEHIGSKPDGTAYCDCVIAGLTVWNTRDDAAMKTATRNSAALPLLAAHLGVAANHTRPNVEADASITAAMARSHHRATVNMADVLVVFGNYYVPRGLSNVEAGPGAAATITAVVEYPAGNCQRLTFDNGSASGTIDDGRSKATDLVTLATSIPAGADFWIRDFRTDSAGIVADGEVSMIDTSNGDVVHTGTLGSIADQTTSCDAITRTPGAKYYPDAIVATTQQHGYCLLGDSRGFGYDDAAGDAGDAVGQVERWILPYQSILNITVNGDAANHFVLHHDNRIGLLGYCSGLIVEYGGNDIFLQSFPTSRVEASLQTIYNYKSYLNGGAGGPVWQTTIPGQTHSSDNWKTVANQTLWDRSANAVAVNDWIRTVPSPLTGYFETADPVETARDSGIWCANDATAQGCTPDGLHPSPYGYNLIQNANPFPVMQ